jgi:hypothetical protein
MWVITRGYHVHQEISWGLTIVNQQFWLIVLLIIHLAPGFFFGSSNRPSPIIPVTSQTEVVKKFTTIGMAIYNQTPCKLEIFVAEMFNSYASKAFKS